MPYYANVIAPGVEISAVQLARRSLGLFVGLAALTCGITLLFLGSEVAMGARPGGTTWVILPTAIFSGLTGFGVYAISSLPVGPRLTPLAWPALFISLGCAFLDSALAAPGGPDVAYVTCAVVFWLTGAVPLVFLARRLKTVLWGPPPPAPAPRSESGVRWISPLRLPGDTRPEAVPLRNDLVGELERLSMLHQAGHLDDKEFAAAKARLLNGAH